MTTDRRPVEPSAKRYLIRAMVGAARDLYGDDGLRDITERMPEQSRIEALREGTAEWVAEAHIIAFGFAAWEGPARRERARFAELIQRQTDLGFGRIKKFLLSVATPPKLLAKAPEFWVQDHTHGKVEVEIEETYRRATITLHDHPFNDWPQTRASMAEAFRYSVSLSRTKAVTETHRLGQKGSLVVRLVWEE